MHMVMAPRSTASDQPRSPAAASTARYDAGLDPETERDLVALALGYIEPKHRLNLLDDRLRRRILRARASFKAHLPADAVEDIVVTARRIEGPMWEVRRGDATLILVGSIDGLSRDMDWRTEALTTAVERADRGLFPVQGRASLADLGRVIWRARTLTRLPEGRTTADYLPPELEARWHADDGVLHRGQRRRVGRRREHDRHPVGRCQP